MTCAQVFSFALLLKNGGRAEGILALLEEGKLQEVKAYLQTLHGATPAGIRQLWQEQRKTEEQAQMQMAAQKFGIEEAQLHPALAAWLAQTH